MDTRNLELPKRILVIEDDRMIRAMLEKTFEPTSTILCAADGREGFEILQRSRPDFVITDLMVPEIDGLTLITRVRRTYYGACVPIMVLTASTGQQVLLECFRQGADDFMVKPFSISELRVRVSSIHLRQKVARDVNPLTRLPGNMVIKNEISCRLEEREPFAMATLDIDHFKAFNDTRGFDMGDEAIKLLGDLLVDYTLDHPSSNVFIGHIGGDDFVALLDREAVNGFASAVHRRFQDATRRFYTPQEIEKGTVTITNRHGEDEEVPLLSVSIGVVTTDRPGLDDYRRIGHVSAEVKKLAKAMPGNSLFVDRRMGPLDSPT